MKNIIRHVLIICISVIALTFVGCFNKTVDSSNLNLLNQVNGTENENETIVSEYGHSPYNIPEDFTFYYNGDILKIPYIFYGGRVESEVGLLIFIDGIVQLFSVGDSEVLDYDYMKIFKTDVNSEETYMLNITPDHGKIGDNLQLNFVCIDFPTLSTLNESFLEWQSMSTTTSWRLLYLQDTYASATPTRNIPEMYTMYNTIEKYNDNNNEFVSVLEESNIIESSRNFIFTKSVGENVGHYRTTIFINNRPAFIDVSNSFIEYIIHKDERLTYKAEIDDNLLEDKNILYAISIRLDNLSNDEMPQVDVFKSNSILVGNYFDY